jgi:hypothetical protein
MPAEDLRELRPIEGDLVATFVELTGQDTAAKE